MSPYPSCKVLQLLERIVSSRLITVGSWAENTWGNFWWKYFYWSEIQLCKPLLDVLFQLVWCSPRQCEVSLWILQYLLAVMCSWVSASLQNGLCKIWNQTAIGHSGRGVCQCKQMVRPSWDVGALPGWITVNLAETWHISTGRQWECRWISEWLTSHMDSSPVRICQGEVRPWHFIFCPLYLLVRHNPAIFPDLGLVYLLVAHTVYSQLQRRDSLEMFYGQTVTFYLSQ